MSVGLLVKIKITLKQIRPFLLNLVPNNVKKKVNLSYLSLPFFVRASPHSPVSKQQISTVKILSLKLYKRLPSFMYDIYHTNCRLAAITCNTLNSA